MRMVTAYTQLLAERYHGKLDENADKFIAYASEGAQRMQVLIHDLLAFSRVGGKEACESIDCNAVMKLVLQALAAAIQESGAAVSHGDLPAVWADRTQVAQVLQLPLHGGESTLCVLRHRDGGQVALTLSAIARPAEVAPSALAAMLLEAESNGVKATSSPAWRK